MTAASASAATTERLTRTGERLPPGGPEINVRAAHDARAPDGLAAGAPIGQALVRPLPIASDPHAAAGTGPAHATMDLPRPWSLGLERGARSLRGNVAAHEGGGGVD